MKTNFTFFSLKYHFLFFSLIISTLGYGQKNINVVLNSNASMKIKFSYAGFYMYISQEGKVMDYGAISEEDVSFDFDGRIKSIGDKSIVYDFDGNVKSIGSISISYDFHNRIQSIDSTSFSYNFDDVISEIGKKSIRYDFNDRVIQIGATSISYDFFSDKIDHISNNDGFVIVEYELED